MQKLIKILFHLLPLLPLCLGYYYLTVAAILVVVVAYIKVIKITKKMETIVEQGHKTSKEYEDLAKLRERWKSLTFVAADFSS